MTSSTTVLERPRLRVALRDHDTPPPEGPAEARVRWLTPARAGLIALLLLTAGVYLYNLTASDYANSFYAAAVQAGTKSWKAFLFGSIDSANFITVDKPPASLWVMELSGRIFGFSSASMLVPQVMEGVAAVWLLHSAVKRWFGAGAGLAAGAMLALTPVAALMFRFNNPDALLVLLLTAGAYCLTRAIEKAGTRWIFAVGALLGFAFLTKMLQAFLVLPGFALVYLIAAPTTPWRRSWQLLVGAAGIVLASGWWIAIVALTPASSRPSIDGSPDNNIFNLIFGYNGLDRITGGSGGPGGGGGSNFSGSTGVFRLFNSLMGGQASWLLPAAFAALALGLWSRRGRPRIDRARAGLLLWGGWLIVTAIVFSFSQGVIHTYYPVALAPAIAALVAIGGRLLWDRRSDAISRHIAAAVILGTAIWAYVLLDRSPNWIPWLRDLSLVAAVFAAAVLVASTRMRNASRRLIVAGLVAGCLAMLAGPTAYVLQTVSTPHTGSTPSAGPTVANSGIGGGGAPGGGTAPTGGGAPRAGSATHGGGFPGATMPGGRGSAPERLPNGAAGKTGLTAGGGGAGGAGVTVSSALVTALKADAGKYRWVAATSGSQSAASIELAAGGEPVMAIGGFNGQGGNLSLAEFESYVKKGEIHYWISGGGSGGMGSGGSVSSIQSWVAAHYKAETIGGETVYNLAR